ncbi:hypothetical protein MPER_06930, partial [Moniliophthora perniciosa FA553]
MENSTPAASDVSLTSQSDLYIQFRIALAAILLLSLGIFTYERTLIPIYASGPTNDYLHYYLALGLALAIYRRPKLSIAQKLLVSGTVLAFTPNATYYLAIWSARYRNPLWGPILVMSVWGSLVASFMLWKRAWPSVLQLRSVSDNQIYLPQALLAFSIGIW